MLNVITKPEDALRYTRQVEDVDEVSLAQATGVWNTNNEESFADPKDWICEPDEAIESSATVEDFQKGIAAGKEVNLVETPAGTLHVWYGVELPPRLVQARKRKRRGTLFVLPAEDKTFSYFLEV